MLDIDFLIFHNLEKIVDDESIQIPSGFPKIINKPSNKDLYKTVEKRPLLKAQNQRYFRLKCKASLSLTEYPHFKPNQILSQLVYHEVLKILVVKPVLIRGFCCSLVTILQIPAMTL